MRTVAMVLGAAMAMAAAGASGMTHAELQSVNEDGSSKWTGGAMPVPFTLRGVWLNDADEMVATNYVEGATSASAGGQFQVFIQAVDEGDRGGTALFMSQWCRNSKASYSREEWEAELARVTHDPETGRAFRKGDVVEVTARAALPYGGKVNVNEGHWLDAAKDFDVRLAKANAGLPRAEAVSAADLEGFDATRATGGEHWQGMRVRLDGIRLAATNGWQADGAFKARQCTAVDAEGREVRLRLPRRDVGAAPAGWFAVTGFVNQEDGDTGGYEVFVQEVGPTVGLAAKGNGRVELSFDADYSDYVLVAADSLDAEEWTPVDAVPVLRVVVEDGSAEAGTRFYRLEKRKE
jgi:hypothetical protein